MPAELDDFEWLAEQYQHRSVLEIAEQLGVGVSSVYRAMDRAGVVRRRQVPELDDVTWLTDRFATTSATNIATEIEVSRRSVYRALERHGIDRHQPRDVPELRDPVWLADRYEALSSGNAIAAELAVSPEQVHRALRRAGITQRSPRGPIAKASELDDADWLRSRYGRVGAPTIAKELGVHVQRVYRALDRHEIPRRPTQVRRTNASRRP